MGGVSGETKAENEGVGKKGRKGEREGRRKECVGCISWVRKGGVLKERRNEGMKEASSDKERGREGRSGKEKGRVGGRKGTNTHPSFTQRK